MKRSFINIVKAVGPGDFGADYNALPGDKKATSRTIHQQYEFEIKDQNHLAY